MRQWLFEQIQKLLFKIRPDLVTIRFTYKSDIERKTRLIQPTSVETNERRRPKNIKNKFSNQWATRSLNLSHQWMGATRDEWKVEAKPRA